MKPTYITACLLLGLAGCGGGGSIYRTERNVIVKKSNQPLFKYNADGSVGDPVGTLNNSPGDTLRSYAFRLSHFGGNYYSIVIGSDTVWAPEGDVLSEYDNAVALQSLKFTLPKDKDQTAWARATQYVTKHSDMKIQTATDNLIQTFNPIKSGYIGFTVTRVPMGETVSYEVSCSGGSIYTSCLKNAQRLAYYMISGNEY